MGDDLGGILDIELTNVFLYIFQVSEDLGDPFRSKDGIEFLSLFRRQLLDSAGYIIFVVIGDPFDQFFSGKSAPDYLQKLRNKIRFHNGLPPFLGIKKHHPRRCTQGNKPVKIRSLILREERICTATEITTSVMGITVHITHLPASLVP